MDQDSPQSKIPSFYQHFASLLRVQTNVSDLHQAKLKMAELKLPSLSRNLEAQTYQQQSSATPSRHRSSDQPHKSPFDQRQGLNYLLSHTNEEQYTLGRSRASQGKRNLSIQFENLISDHKNSVQQLHQIESINLQQSPLFPVQSRNLTNISSCQSFVNKRSSSMQDGENVIQRNISVSKIQFAKSNSVGGDSEIALTPKFQQNESSISSIPRLQLDKKYQLQNIKADSIARLAQAMPVNDADLIRKQRDRTLARSPTEKRDFLTLIMQGPLRTLDYSETPPKSVFTSKKHSPVGGRSPKISEIDDNLLYKTIRSKGDIIQNILTTVESPNKAPVTVSIKHKLYNNRLDLANDQMMILIGKQSNAVDKTIQVLQFQQQQQLKRNWKIAHEPLKVVIEEYDKIQAVLELKKDLEKQKRRPQRSGSLEGTGTQDDGTTTNNDGTNTIQDGTTVMQSELDPTTPRTQFHGSIYQGEEDDKITNNDFTGTNKTSMQGLSPSDGSPAGKKGGFTQATMRATTRITMPSLKKNFELTPNHLSSMMNIQDDIAFGTKIKQPPQKKFDSSKSIQIKLIPPEIIPESYKDIIITEQVDNKSFESNSLQDSSTQQDFNILPQIQELEGLLQTVQSQVSVVQIDTTQSSFIPDPKENVVIQKTDLYDAKKNISDEIKESHFLQNMKSYDDFFDNNESIQLQVKYLCEHSDTRIAPFAILQSMIQGRLVMRDVLSDFQLITQLYSSSSSNSKPKKVDLIIIDNCDINDQLLAQIINDHKPRDIALRSIKLGPYTLQALSQSSATINLIRCQFPEDNLQKLLIPRQSVIKLFVRGCQLSDRCLSAIASSYSQLTHLDLSQNLFRPDSVIRLIEGLQRTNLRFLSLQGVNLNSGQPHKMSEGLVNLVLKKFIQHIDLSQTQIDIQCVEELILALHQAKSLQSIHLPWSQNISQIAAKCLGKWLHNRQSVTIRNEDVPKDWFVKPQIPHLEQDDITGELSHHLFSSRQLSYVLSRLIGRPDLSNHNIILTNCKETKSDDNLVETEPLKRQAEINLRHTEKSWVESNDCWICHRWSYCLPLITKTMLEDSYYTNDQSKFILTQAQDRILERLLTQQKIVYSDLLRGQAYIIGEATNFHFLPMQNLGQYLSKLDKEADNVKAETNGVKKAFQQYYIPKFKLLMNKELKARQRFQLDPYNTPFLMQFNETPVSDLNLFEQVWVHSCMLKPGFNEFFVVYRFDEDRFFKGLLRKVVPIREIEVHQYKIPVQQKIQTRVDKSNPFNLLRAFKTDTPEHLSHHFEQDIKLWKVRDLGTWQVEGITKDDPQLEYNTLVDLLRSKQNDLMMGFKYLVSKSKSYPLLNFRDMQDWLKIDLDIIGDGLSFKQFDSLYRVCKQFTLNRNSMAEKTKSTTLKRKRTVRVVPRRRNAAGNILTTHDNELTRFMWYEFIVRIASMKYKNSGLKGSYELTPTECFEKFLSDSYLKWIYKMNQTDLSSKKATNFINDELINNEKVAYALFKNQFGIHKIYQTFLKQFDEAEPSPDKDRVYYGESPVKQLQQREEQRANNYLATVIQAQIDKLQIEDEEQEDVKEESKVGRSPRHTSKNVLLQQNAKSSFKPKGSLKKKEVTMLVKREFLHLGPPVVGLGKNFLFLKVKQYSDVDAEVFTDLQLQYAFTHSKMVVFSAGNQRLTVQADMMRQERLLWIEFVVFICFLANHAYSKIKQNGFYLPFNERLQRFMTNLLVQFDEEWINSELLDQNMPDQVVGLDKIQDILLNGKIQEFVPLTPQSQVQSYYPDMFSEIGAENK